MTDWSKLLESHAIHANLQGSEICLSKQRETEKAVRKSVLDVFSHKILNSVE